ncbi:MAG: PDGLE domain-containing protein [Candidatus Bathyarchaeota archaeon]|nr:PDGLE domain-containing protein [Candidatus Bathyarchaeota archaeon]
MKKYLIASALLIIFLAVFIPLASSDPDGLEKVAETLGVEEQETVWRGLMPDYTVATVENPYLSTLLAGVFGTLTVLAVALLFGKTIRQKKTTP